MLVLCNLSKKCLEALSNIVFPEKLNLQIEHYDEAILNNLIKVKLQTDKIQFSIFKLKASDKKTKEKKKDAIMPIYLNESLTIKSDMQTHEEESCEEDLVQGLSNPLSNEIDSVSSSYHGPAPAITNQLQKNTISEIEGSNRSFLNNFKIIETLVSDIEASQETSNPNFLESLKIIKFITNIVSAKAEFEQKIEEYKHQINKLNLELKTKDINEKKMQDQQGEIATLKQLTESLKSDLKNITSETKSANADQSKLLSRYILETSQLREENLNLEQENKNLKIQLSTQTAEHKRRYDEVVAEGFQTNKKQKTGLQTPMILNNNFSQDPPVGTANNIVPGNTQRYPLFFSSPRAPAPLCITDTEQSQQQFTIE